MILERARKLCCITICSLSLKMNLLDNLCLLFYDSCYNFCAGTNFASKFLRANGITLLKVREETLKLLGKADLFFFSPEHPPLTEDAQKALDWAMDEKLKSGNLLSMLSAC